MPESDANRPRSYWRRALPQAPTSRKPRPQPLNKSKPLLLKLCPNAESREAIVTAHRLAQLCGQVSRYARMNGSPKNRPHGSLFTKKKSSPGWRSKSSPSSAQAILCTGACRLPHCDTECGIKRGHSDRPQAGATLLVRSRAMHELWAIPATMWRRDWPKPLPRYSTAELPMVRKKPPA